LSSLLARYADCVFWMARQVERAENVARILDVTHSAATARDRAGEWAAVLEIHSDSERFRAAHGPVAADAVVHFYTLDAGNPTSILCAVSTARENARTLRPFISTEMWTQLNVFYNWLRGLKPADLAPHERPRLLAAIKQSCQTHAGITDGTFFRDQGWYFCQIGRYLERADQATRLLDVKFHRLSSAGDYQPLEAGQAGALLRSAAGYHAFRRLHPRGMVPAEVAAFLLNDEAFPRSVALCVDEVNRLLHELRQRHRLRGGGAALEKLDDVQAALTMRPTADILRTGLHDFLDWVQLQLAAVTDTLTRDFFGR
jgi:uncharacterized alpha-E superfamily protein